MRHTSKIFQLFFLQFLVSVSFSQFVFPTKGIVFNDEIVPRIDIEINPDSLDHMLDSDNLESNHEYKANFTWSDGVNNEIKNNIGFRLRGNTSRSAQKKSFKVKFDQFEDSRFYGLSEMNLNGEHNDPSISRAKIGWDLMRLADIEAPRSNHIRLYINGEYRGLYLNVEHIDNDYLRIRNKSSNGQLFKCLYGADFVYRGNNQSQYKDNVYEPANNKDKVDKYNLVEFIKTLDKVDSPEDRCELEKIFDVDRYLRIMAMEILIGHWDNPMYNIHNTYLYFNDKSGKLEIISFDIDNTFGIDWFGIDWTERNIYSWAKSNSERPLYNNLMKVPEYKVRFGYYIDKYIREFYNPSYLKSYLDNIKNKLVPYAAIDEYANYDYGYQFQDFLKSFESEAGDHVKYGIKEFIEARQNNANSQLQNNNIAPFIVNHTSVRENNNLKFEFNILKRSDSRVFINYQLDNESWLKKEILDNGISPDEISNDGKFTFELLTTEHEIVNYFYELIDANEQESRIPFCDFYTEIVYKSKNVGLYINEFMADNKVEKDENNEYEDLIEIYNATDNSIYLGDYYLSDDKNNPTKWLLPYIDLAAKSFTIIWADEDEEQGINHCNFKLSKDGEFIGIYESDENYNAPIDTFSYSATLLNTSYGKYPDGIGDVVRLSNITLGYSNVLSNVEENNIGKLLIYPYPANDVIHILSLQNNDRVQIFDLMGRVLMNVKFTEYGKSTIDVSHLDTGTYFIKSINVKNISTGKFLISR